jgi:predicted acyl esterase
MDEGLVSTIAPGWALRRELERVPDEARQYAVAMRDGVRLATDVYLPGRGRWPVLMCRTPYDKAGSECFLPDIASWFCDRGFAVVLQDVRGKARSDGEFDPHRQEIADGHDTLGWIAAQPWCSGRIGAFGDSYSGYAAWAAAATGHRNLGAIAPRVCSPDVDAMRNRGGVLQLEQLCLWALETALDEWLYDGALDWSIRPLSRIVPAALGVDAIPAVDRALESPVPPLTLPPGSRTAVLHLGGWWDIMRAGQMDAWRAMRRRRGDYLVMDAVDHAWLPVADPGARPRDPRSTAGSWHRFLDRYLGGLHEFFSSVLTDRLEHSLPHIRINHPWIGWREEPEWPPSGVRRELLYLEAHADGGRLSPSPPPPSRAAWRHDPCHPVPSLVNPFWTFARPPDLACLASRDDVQSFALPEQGRPMDLAGPAAVIAAVSSSALSAHVIATLVDVYPDGRRLSIATGAAEVRGPWPRRISVDIGDVCCRIRPGHRLAVHVASSSYPAMAVHPGTDEPPWTATQTQPNDQSLHCGGDDPSVLMLTTRPCRREQ